MSTWIQSKKKKFIFKMLWGIKTRSFVMNMGPESILLFLPQCISFYSCNLEEVLQKHSGQNILTDRQL